MSNPLTLLERARGIEPLYEAWEASVLPLNYARAPKRLKSYNKHGRTKGEALGAAVSFCGVYDRRYTSFTFFSGRLRTGLPVAA